MNELESTLLDLHLGRLSPTDEAEIRLRIASDPILARRSEALASVFAALSTAREVPPASADLRMRIESRIAAAGRAPRLVTAAGSHGADANDGDRFILRIHSLRDVLAVAAVLVLAVGLGLPALLQVREKQQRSMCAANMARLGQGIQSYATVFGDSLPFRGWQRGSTWQPTDEPGVQTLPNRKHMYLLLSGGNAQPQWFICPSSDGVPMPADEVRRRDDFLDPDNISFAYQNMSGARPTIKHNPNLPILADDNPNFDNGHPLDLSRLGLAEPSLANSRAHGGRGQNVLTSGGHVLWTTTPACGVDGDNIWTLQGVNRYTGREGPAVESDSHLLK